MKFGLSCNTGFLGNDPDLAKRLATLDVLSAFAARLDLAG